MKKKLFLFLIGLIFLNCSNDDDDGNQSSCDFKTFISSELYITTPSDQLIINSLEIDNNCLKINFSSNGCSGETWEVQLIDAEGLKEILPLQRCLKLSLKNEEDCEAIISKELVFDISNLKTPGDSIYLNFDSSDKGIFYKY